MLVAVELTHLTIITKAIIRNIKISSSSTCCWQRRYPAALGVTAS
jgi:hypothetical protein